MPSALLADENLSSVTIRLLREQGFDVLSIAESRPSIRDVEVLEMASRQQRWLLTFDGDYGDLIFNQRLLAPPGVVYLRFSPVSPQEPAERIIQALDKYRDVRAFIVVGRKAGMRMRPLPVND
ncbi:MAG: DUF5615 family PIN-like protein [Rudaea sp.]